MADDYDDAEDLLGGDDDVEWLYVEDEYNLADELAESQVADPGYPGTNYELSMEEYEYDLFAYFDDLDYGDDSYWERDRPRHHHNHNPEPEREPSARNRKRRAPATAARSKKRKRAGARVGGPRAAGAAQLDPVVYVGQQERSRTRLPPVLEKSAGHAFLGDWRSRFAGMDGIIRRDVMPAAMQQAAAARHEDPQVEDPPRHPEAVGEDEGDGQDGDDRDWGDAAGETDLSLLDPDMLKQILKQKLRDAGLEGSDEGAFMHTLRRMLAGDEDAAAGELARTLLGQATGEEGEGAFSGWLSQQGVSLEQGEDDDGSEVAPDDVAEKRRGARGGETKRRSPPDRAVSGMTVSQAGAREGAVRGASAGTMPPPSTRPARSDSRNGMPNRAPRAARGHAGPAPTAEERNSAPLASPSKPVREALRDDVEAEADLDLDLDVHKVPPTSARKRKAPSQEDPGASADTVERATKEPATRRTRSARAKGAEVS